MRIVKLSAVMVLVASALPLAAQEKRESPARSFYTVELNIRDGAPGAAENGRRYSMMLDNEGRGSFRVGTRVPYVTGTFQAPQGQTATTQNQYSYFDAGVNIDCRVREVGQYLALNGQVDISSVIPPDKTGAGPNPTINSLRLDMSALLKPGKTSTVATVNDPVTMRRFELDATVTKVE